MERKKACTLLFFRFDIKVWKGFKIRVEMMESNSAKINDALNSPHGK